MAKSYGSSNGELSASIRNCCQILKSYSWLIDAYILDFFVEDMWKRLPDSWRQVMADADFEELGSWLDLSLVPRYSRPWPLSLLALRVASRSLCLPRRSSSPRPHPVHSATTSAAAASTAPAEPRHCAHADLQMDAVATARLRRAFHKHVSPKKIHEIFKMADVVCRRAHETGVRCVVDVGSGVGHLARLLSFGHGLSVCCIEAQHKLTSTARKLDGEVEDRLSKIIPEDRRRMLSRPTHLTASVGPDMEKADFLLLVSQAFQQMKSPADLRPSSTEFGIVGLHPCGDLAPYLIRMFADSPEARFICIAGCCYMKLTPGRGFPLSPVTVDPESAWPRELNLSYEAREMACHAIEAYSRNLLCGNTSSLKIHCYRATLESIIIKNWPKFRRRGMKSFKYDDNLLFPEYARRVLSAVNLIPPEEDIASTETNEYLSCWQQVVCFYSLRLMFAPLVESLILFDRCLFLSLKGISCEVSPEFDPDVSPRNHLLIASKPKELS